MLLSEFMRILWRLAVRPNASFDYFDEDLHSCQQTPVKFSLDDFEARIEQVFIEFDITTETKADREKVGLQHVILYNTQTYS